jgi:hypothetical protein
MVLAGMISSSTASGGCYAKAAMTIRQFIIASKALLTTLLSGNFGLLWGGAWCWRGLQHYTNPGR